MHSADDIWSSFFIARNRGCFLWGKIMQTPKFLQELISSPEYGDKNSETYKRATKYMNILYPGTVAFDATGRMMRPEYDMTLEQFYDAQHEIETEFESDKSEAEADVLDTYGDYFETIGFNFDIEEYVVPGTPILVKVLMPGGHVSKRSLETYALNIPEFEIKPKIWIWRSEHGENTCDDCLGNDGTVFEAKEDIPTCPVHPNCRCWVEEIELDKNGKKIVSKVYKGQKPETQKVSDMKFEQAYNKLKEPEGGYTDGKNQRKDEPTNMGIKQSTLDRYANKHPDKNSPADVKYLTAAQAKEIYKNEYWDNTRIPEIKNDRIRDAVFDMNVMGGAGKTVQRALNSFLDANLVVDGAIGSETIKSINAIPDNAVNEFMVALKSERIDYLKGTKNWVTAKNGWLKRVNKY